MHSGQSGIFALGTGSHAYLEFDLKPGIEPLQMVQAIASVRKPSITTGGVNLVVGFRPELWARPAPDQIPPLLRLQMHSRSNTYNLFLDGHELLQ